MIHHFTKRGSNRIRMSCSFIGQAIKKGTRDWLDDYVGVVDLESLNRCCQSLDECLGFFASQNGSERDYLAPFFFGETRFENTCERVILITSGMPTLDHGFRGKKFLKSKVA